MKIKPTLLMKIYSFVLFLFCLTASFAQNTTAKISSIKADGLHQIVLPTSIRSASKDDLSDFRIFDGNGTEVPYYNLKKETETLQENFSGFEIIASSNISKKSSTLIIDLNSTQKRNKLNLIIANSDVVKTYNLSGSNDQKSWFGLSNKQVLFDLSNPADTFVFKTIEFPLSSYRYLKIDFDDTKTLPIHVLKVGDVSHKIEKSSLLNIGYQSKSVKELSSEKKTLITIVFDKKELVNKITFEEIDAKFFKRQVHVYQKVIQTYKRKTDTILNTIASFELNSNSDNSFDIQQQHYKQLYLEIENLDSPPLQFAAIKFSQYPISIIADLKKDQNYIIKTGNAALTSPQYDLSVFQQNIKNTLPEATVTEIEINTTKLPEKPIKSFWMQPWFMWVCISLGAIVVLYFASSLVKDLNKNN
jgi:hypothetical protein